MIKDTEPQFIVMSDRLLHFLSRLRADTPQLVTIQLIGDKLSIPSLMSGVLEVNADGIGSVEYKGRQINFLCQILRLLEPQPVTIVMGSFLTIKGICL